MKCENCNKRPITTIVWDGIETVNCCGICKNKIRRAALKSLDLFEKLDPDGIELETADDEFIKSLQAPND